MSKEYIAVANSKRDSTFIKRHYNDATGVCIQLKTEISNKRSKGLPDNVPVWLHSGVDAVERGKQLKNDWKEFLNKFQHGGKILKNCQNQNSTSKSEAKSFARSVMNLYTEYNPKWVSIPQIPVENGRTSWRNKLNRDFAEGVNEWYQESEQDFKLMLPLILNHLDVFNSKTKYRNDKIAEIKNVIEKLEEGFPHGLWIVNSKLDDETSSAPNEQDRFPGIINFHEELQTEMNDYHDILLTAGPYWAINLILWARQLIDLPVISVATGYRYYVPGSPLFSPKDRICIPTFRRRAKRNPDLKNWLKKAARKLENKSFSESDFPGIKDRLENAAKDLSDLANNYDKLTGQNAHEQVARCYKKWLDKLTNISAEMRALYMRQDFSSADVTGRVVGNLPPNNKPQNPGKLARMYMLNCF